MGAPEYAVTGISSIERLSAGQVRISKYSQRKDGNFVLSTSVDLAMWIATIRLIEEGRDAIVAEQPSTPR